MSPQARQYVQGVLEPIAAMKGDVAGGGDEARPGWLDERVESGAMYPKEAELVRDVVGGVESYGEDLGGFINPIPTIQWLREKLFAGDEKERQRRALADSLGGF